MTDTTPNDPRPPRPAGSPLGPDHRPASRCYDCGIEHTPREEELIEKIWTSELTEAEEKELNDFTEANHPTCFQ